MHDVSAGGRQTSYQEVVVLVVQDFMKTSLRNVYDSDIETTVRTLSRQKSKTYY